MDEFIRLAQDAGWLVRVMSRRWVSGSSTLPGWLRSPGTGCEAFRMPDEPDELPAADAVVVAPVTFNTVNKWAAGITDTFAAGLLCELTGLGVPIIAVPLVKDALARYVAFSASLEILHGMGVRVMFDPQAPPQSRMPSWPKVMENCTLSSGMTRAGVTDDSCSGPRVQATPMRRASSTRSFLRRERSRWLTTSRAAGLILVFCGAIRSACRIGRERPVPVGAVVVGAAYVDPVPGQPFA